MFVSNPCGSWSKASTVPAGSASKAASVGANNVKGPAPFKVFTSPAAPIAASKVLWSSEPIIISVTVFGGNKTEFITWTTPFSAIISATVTRASSIKTPSLLIVTLTVLPLFKVIIV